MPSLAFVSPSTSTTQSPSQCSSTRLMSTKRSSKCTTSGQLSPSIPKQESLILNRRIRILLMLRGHLWSSSPKRRTFFVSSLSSISENLMSSMKTGESLMMTRSVLERVMTKSINKSWNQRIECFAQIVVDPRFYLSLRIKQTTLLSLMQKKFHMDTGWDRIIVPLVVDGT